MTHQANSGFCQFGLQNEGIQENVLQNHVKERHLPYGVLEEDSGTKGFVDEANGRATNSPPITWTLRLLMVLKTNRISMHDLRYTINQHLLSLQTLRIAIVTGSGHSKPQ